MKLSLLLVSLLVIGCAGGPEEDPPVVETTYGSFHPRPAPTPDASVAETSDNHCVVITDWINDCEVTKVYCYDELKRLDIKCGGGRYLFPWEYIPDPPPPWVDHNRKY